MRIAIRICQPSGLLPHVCWIRSDGDPFGTGFRLFHRQDGPAVRSLYPDYQGRYMAWYYLDGHRYSDLENFRRELDRRARVARMAEGVS